MKHLLEFYNFINETVDLTNYYKYNLYKVYKNVDKDNIKYITYVYTFLDDKNRKYYVNLYLDVNDGTKFSVDFMEEESYLNNIENSISPLDYEFKNTNRFDSFKVLNTVFKIVKDFYQDNRIFLRTLIFSADFKRKEIYKKFINKVFPSWELIVDETDNLEISKLKYFYDKILNLLFKNKKLKSEENKKWYVEYKIPFKKNVTYVYSIINDLPGLFRNIIDELFENLDVKKLYKINDNFCYGDYDKKLTLFKINDKSYLNLYIKEPYYNNRIRVYDEIYDNILNYIKSNLDKLDRITRIKNHYDLKVDYHSDNDDSIKVGWDNSKNQKIRWDILLDGVKNGDSILDFGCGIGDLYNYMNEKYNDFKYYGVDISENYINLAKNKYPNVNFKLINNLDDINFNYDWFIASGVFTVYTTVNDLLDYIDKAYNQSKKGVSFNLIDEKYYPNIDNFYEKRRGYNKLNIFSIFKEKYQNVKLIEKYLKPNKDFTIQIYK